MAFQYFKFVLKHSRKVNAELFLFITVNDAGLKHIKQQRDLLAGRRDFSLAPASENSVLLTFTAPSPEGAS